VIAALERRARNWAGQRVRKFSDLRGYADRSGNGAGAPERL